MQRNNRRLAARLLAAVSALVMTAGAASLIVGYAHDRRNASIDKEQLAALELLAKQDVSHIPALLAEWQRQTEASLGRAAKTRQQTNVLIIAAILFLIGAKLSIAFGGRVLPTLDRITAIRASLSRPGGRRPQGGQTGACPHATCHGGESPEIDLRVVADIIERHGRGREAVIPILNDIQSHSHYLPDDALRYICEHTEITPARIVGVSSFYRRFRRTPTGEHLVKVCHGTACHVAGAQNISNEIRRELGISDEADTDPQRLFTIEEVACLGCCTLAPVVQIDETTYGHLAPEMVPAVLNESLQVAGKGTNRRVPAVVRSNDSAAPLGEIRIGLGSCCVAGGSGKVYEALERAVAATGARTTIKRVGCVGMCHQTPLVEAVVAGRPASLYAAVTPQDAGSIVRRHFRSGGIGRRLADSASAVFDAVFNDRQLEPIIRRSIDVRDPPVAAFLGRQVHIATEHCGRLDPTDLDEYLRHDGFKALEHCVTTMAPLDVIEEVRRSGLRGRGGAGYPTNLKWSKVRSADAEVKYIVCNGDEGDPGAFMDRMLMESFPYRIIEGMAIAAYAVGAHQGYFYIRAEYPLAVRRIRDALRVCEQRGFLGEDVFGTGLRLKLRIMEGAGAFICGEETALLASIEGERGSPRFRPPYPADKGLWGKPTLVGNVETWATVPWIIRHGATAFSALGTATSKGTKVFALAGKVKRGGLIEVPMGVTIREIVEEIGGGIKGGRQFKAVQIGGPSGGCVPESLADTPVDYEALTRVGAIMGSGGLVVLDDSDCMVDIARYFLAFTQDQSCGKCTFCRIGTRRMLDILDRLCTGQGRPNDIEMLEELAYSVKSGSLCGLGKTAPNPVLSTLRYFRGEYQAHLEGRCPAGKCKDLITYRVTDDCIGCTLCAQHCPVEAIAFAPYQKHAIDVDKCTRCDICRSACPESAIKVE